MGYFTFVRQRTAFQFFRFSAGALFTGAGVLREDLHPVLSVVGRAFAARPGLMPCLVRAASDRPWGQWTGAKILKCVPRGHA